MKKILLSATLLMSSISAFAATVWVDVRTPAEYQSGHVSRATNLPYGEQFVHQVAQAGYAKDDYILLYCRSGHRASLAKAALEKAGYSHVQNLGGFDALKATGAVKTQ